MFDDFCNIGRNDACWCGSGKKYKKCHSEFDAQLQKLHDEGFLVPPRQLIKTAEDIEGIKESSVVNRGALDVVAENIREGCTTLDIDNWVHDYTFDHGAIPAPLDFEGFPKSCCTSVNDVVCHGIPSSNEVLKAGDIVNVDCSTEKNGYFSDSSRMFIIGEVDKKTQKLVDVTKKSINVGLEVVKPWFCLSDLAIAIDDYIEDNGFSVVRDYGGHGIGKEFHEDPWVSHSRHSGSDMIMPPGMCFTIEPMINMGKYKIRKPGADGWTVRTKDGSLSAQWEIQLVVTETGYEILTW